MGSESQWSHSSSILPFVSLAAAGCFWGTGFLFGKIAFSEMTVSENVGYRFAFASISLLPLLFRNRLRFRDRRSWLLLILAGCIGVPVQFLLQFKGLEATTVSHASLIVGTLPVLLALSSAVFFDDKLTALEYGLMLLSAAGAVLIAFAKKTSAASHQPTLKGDMLVFVSMIAAVAMILVTKHLMVEKSSLEITATMLTTGTLMLVAWVEMTNPLRIHFSSKVWFAVLAQALLATTAAYLCWNWGLARVPASQAGVFLNLEPLVGTLLGVSLLHETLGPLAIVGGAMILISAAYFSRR